MLLSIIRSLCRRLRTVFAAKFKIKKSMKPTVHLYLREQEVELSSTPDILYNFSADDIMSPAAVKNSYSKTVKIPGTDRNNRIFNSIWDLSSTGFNAGKRTPFSIYLDGDLYETGYARLDSFTRNKNKYEYSVSLFGGLGSFFYSLAYSEDSAKGDGVKKKLSDLVFRYEGEGSQEVDFGFTINMDTVKEAWDSIGAYSTKWRFLNFCPTAYNGLPEDFDADKVMIIPGATRSSGRAGVSINNWPSAVTEDNKTYVALGGYAVAEMDRERTEAEMREFRSYLQRPVIRVKEVINACCLPENNGGYSVNLDSDFFNGEVPYWEDLWCTLPMLTSLDYTSEMEPDDDITATIGNPVSGSSVSGTTNIFYEDRTISLEGQGDNAISLTVTFKLGADILNSNFTYWNTSGYHISQNLDYAGGVGLQLVAYDAFGNAVAGSDYIWCASVHHRQRGGSNGRTEVPITYGPGTFNYDFYGTDYQQLGGSFLYSNGHYIWQGNKNISLKIKNVPTNSTVKLLITKMGISAGRYYSTPLGQAVFTPDGTVDSKGVNNWTASTITGFTLYDVNTQIDVIKADAIRTGAKFTKKDILNTDYSPLDFLLSYCKLFGLYFRKDPTSNTIDILTRGNFFNPTGTPIDISDKIDVTSQTVKPLAFDKKWYRWDTEKEESEIGEEYEQVYGRPYGEQLINTGYEFNNETEDVLKDNIFRGAVQCCERSTDFCYIPSKPYAIPWEFNGFKYQLYNEDDSSESKEVTIDPKSTIDAFSAMTEYKYYDVFDRIQLHSADNSPSEGGNVLLFNYGTGSLITQNGDSLGYYLTDDNAYMYILNDGTACWLRTDKETDKQGNRVAIALTEVPKFGRYEIYPTSGYIIKSLDFGEPQTLFIPGAISRPEGTMYNTFWKNYISDLYSKDSRVLSTKMLIEERPTVDWLRKWYYFDNSIWRLLKIKDYNVGTYGLTDVEFVKVQDRLNYANSNFADTPTITFTLSNYNIAGTGETVTWTVQVSDGGHWYMEWWAENGTEITVNGLDDRGGATGDASGTIVFPANTMASQNETYHFYVFADPASTSAVATQTPVNFSVTRNDSNIIPASGGTTTWTIASDYPWTASTSYATLTPSTGEATEGTIMVMDVPENTYFSSRQMGLYVTNGYSTYRNPYAVTQQAAEGESITFNPPPYMRYFPSTGVGFDIYVSSTGDWNYWGDVSNTTLTQRLNPASTTSFRYIRNQNTGATFFEMVYGELKDYPSIRTEYYYVYQMPTFALFYGSADNNWNPVTPSNSTTGFTADGTFVQPSANEYRAHKPGNNAIQPFDYSYELAFPEEITDITNGAFEGCSGLTSIYCSGITTIGYAAFAECTNLTGVTMPDVQVIDTNAFAHCDSLTALTLPSTLQEIHTNAFLNSNLQTLVYEGTMVQWAGVQLGENWKSGTNIQEVQCSDGYVQV